MKILWVCGLVLNDFTEEFGIRKRPNGTWMENLYHALDNTDIEIGLCFPIYDEHRRKNSKLNGVCYYSFNGKMDSELYSEEMKDEFIDILNDFQPDVIHIWGSEYTHSRAMFEAATSLGIENRVLLRIQGIISEVYKYYFKDIPEKYWFEKDINGHSLEDKRQIYKSWSQSEKELLSRIKYAYGRGDWDTFYLKSLNPTVKTDSFNNILRSSFYENQWNLNKCNRYSLFLSQAYETRKGLHYLLEAVYILKRKYNEIKVFIGGSSLLDVQDGYANYIMDLIHDYDLRYNIVFTGELNEAEMVARYLKSHVSVCPSVVENRANSICEAMMLGVPTVSSYVGGNVGVVAHGEEGFLYPADEVCTLAGYIDRIFSDDELALNMSLKARKRALGRHNKEYIVRRTMALYNRIMQNIVQ
jgi:glycosyltransferase involved in cell wall biosynthesis